ncbi:MAG: serine hydrolase [Gammaproteobacteria bacterium]|nr:serine hydrolase [Gammaproteobacteria bacterium]
MKSNLMAIAGCGLLVFSTAIRADAPTIDPANDEQHFGDRAKELFWTPEQQVSGYRNMEKLSPARKVAAGDKPYPLPKDEVDLGDIEIITDDLVMTVNDYVKRQNVAGLIVVKDGTLVYERYELGNTAESRWISYSVAKSVTSLLIGAAIKDGYIKSVDESVTDYLPRLKNSSYDASTIRNLLQMSSGVQWNEDYADPESDINTVPWHTLSVYEYLRQKPRASAPGEVFNYNTAETNLVGTLLRSAIGNNLSTYLSEKIWQPFGMERDAYWVLSEPGGGEFGGSSLNATLRDYARIGLFAMRNGELCNGQRVLPVGWMDESLVPSKGYEGYGYLWWLRGGGAYSARGIFGQGIYINPVENVVIALHSARADASVDRDRALQAALYEALTNAVRN